MTAPTKRALKAACETLASVDPALARAYNEIGLPTWRDQPASYAMLARIVTYQQISTKAAASIWGRVVDAYGEDMPPQTILAATEDDLRACGLSRPKVRHFTSIAEAIVTGALSFDRICAAPLNEARKELLAVKGIGPWTAELVLLYAIGAVDAFPVGDVGLMESHRKLGGYDTRMGIKAFTQHAEIWRPHRGVAAHLLWDWLNHFRAASKPPI